MICLLSAVDLLLSSSAAHYCSHKAARSGERQRGEATEALPTTRSPLVNLGVCSLKIATAVFIGSTALFLFLPHLRAMDAGWRWMRSPTAIQSVPAAKREHSGFSHQPLKSHKVYWNFLLWRCFFCFLTIQKSSELTRWAREANSSSHCACTLEAWPERWSSRLGLRHSRGQS